jgi:hypothetical protein
MPATDIFQQHMGDLFYDMTTINTFMDYLIVLGFSTFCAHLIDVNKVLTRLKDMGMQVNTDNALGFMTLLSTLVSPSPEPVSNHN